MDLMKTLWSLAFLVAASCAPDSSSIEGETREPTGPKEAIITASVSPNAFERPEVIGLTNLPTGAQLLVTLSRPDTAFGAEDKVSVANGRYSAGPFTDGGDALLPGSYEITITAPLADVQPDEVRRLVGAAYSNYTGPLVNRSGIGTTLSYTTTFTVPGATTPEAIETERQRSQQDFRQWAQQNCEDIFLHATDREQKVADCIAGATENLQ